MEQKDGENSPGRAQDELGDPGGEAHASGASEGDKDPRNRPKTAQNALEQAREHSKGRSQEDSPRAAQADLNDPRHEADASQASGSVEGTSTTSNELRKVSECERKCSERRRHKNSPSRPREVPYDPGGETAIPGGIHNVQEGPEGIRNERADETDASGRVTGPGGYLELQGESRVIEVDWDRRNVVKRAGYNGKRPKRIRDARDVGIYSRSFPAVVLRVGGPS